MKKIYKLLLPTVLFMGLMLSYSTSFGQSAPLQFDNSQDCAVLVTLTAVDTEDCHLTCTTTTICVPPHSTVYIRPICGERYEWMRCQVESRDPNCMLCQPADNNVTLIVDNPSHPFWQNCGYFNNPDDGSLNTCCGAAVVTFATSNHVHI